MGFEAHDVVLGRLDVVKCAFEVGALLLRLLFAPVVGSEDLGGQDE